MKLFKLKSLLDSQKIAKISFFLLLIFLLSLSSFKDIKADLVDDLIKKHKLDPKNNPKDQCWLMDMLQREISKNGTRNGTEISKNGIKIGEKIPVCIKKEVCQLFVPFYHFDKNPKLEGITGEEIIIYRPSSNIIIGRAADIEVDSDNFYDPSIIEFKEYVKKHHNFYAQDFKKDQRFKKFDIEYNQKSNFNYKMLIVTSSKTRPRQGIAYFKIDGCYIRESSLLEEYLQRNLTQNSN